MAENPVLWFLGNLGAPLFSHSDVLELGAPVLTSDTLQNWANRKIVSPQTIEGNKRRYDTYGMGQVILSLPLIQLGQSPLMAAGMINEAMLLTMRNLVDEKKVKVAAGDLPLGNVHRMFCVYAAPGILPIIVDRDKLGDTLARNAAARLVIPFGKMLVDLAKRAQKIADARRVLPIGGTEEVIEHALAALGKSGEAA